MKNPENSTLNVTIPVASIDSGVDKFDEHLVSADFFLMRKNHPHYHFYQHGYQSSAYGGPGSVTGELTIKGIYQTCDVYRESQ